MPAMTQLQRQSGGPATSVVDFAVQGVVGIRLVDPSSCDVAAVVAATGAKQVAPLDEPEITIRFVSKLRPGEIRYVEPGETGFTDDTFLVLPRAYGKDPLAEVPLDSIGRQCDIVCSSGLGFVPLLRPVLDHAMLAKGVVVLHASAFRYKGRGTLVAGWARGGKTTSLLAFMRGGAEFIADDHVYVNSDGNRLCGIPEPISLRASHLDEMPEYRRSVRGLDRAALRGWSAIGRLVSSAASREGDHSIRKLTARVAGIAENACIRVPPERLFGKCITEGKLDKVFLAIAHQSPDVRAERVDADWLADRLIFSLRAERRRLLDQYLAFRFAFPDRRSELLERVNEIERDVLTRVLSDAESYVVYHPLPAPVVQLFETMAPLVA
jgi:hypothetical protein